jgi:hypothetical protein
MPKELRALNGPPRKKTRKQVAPEKNGFKPEKFDR